MFGHFLLQSVYNVYVGSRSMSRMIHRKVEILRIST